MWDPVSERWVEICRGYNNYQASCADARPGTMCPWPCRWHYRDSPDVAEVDLVRRLHVCNKCLGTNHKGADCAVPDSEVPDLTSFHIYGPYECTFEVWRRRCLRDGIRFREK